MRLRECDEDAAESGLPSVAGDPIGATTGIESSWGGVTGPSAAVGLCAPAPTSCAAPFARLDDNEDVRALCPEAGVSGRLSSDVAKLAPVVEVVSASSQ